MLAIVASLLLTAGPATAADEVDRYLEAQIHALHIPGLSLAVVRDGTVVKTAGYGLADLEQRVPATADTVYEMGSTGKALTAALVMMMVEEGRLRLEDPLTRYFPKGPEFWSRVTVSHLLSHAGGIQNHVAVPGYLGVFRTNLFYEPSPSKDDLLARFYELPKEFEPGETWSYDNTGYILMGWILEQASGRPYWDLLQERIFGPLGMRASRNTDPRALVALRARGYGWANGAYENRAVLWPHVAFSAGSVLSTVGDLARWDAALQGDRLLTKASRERIFTPARTRDGARSAFDYGLGWFVDSYHGHRVAHHSGGTPGFSSVIHRYPEDRLAVIMMANRGDRFLDQLAIDVAGMYAPALRRPEGAADPDPATTARHKDVFASLLSGHPDTANMTPPLRLFFQTATGRGFWTWVAEHGALGAFTFSDEERRPDGRTRRYAATLDGSRYWFAFDLAMDGRIEQVDWW